MKNKILTLLLLVSLQTSVCWGETLYLPVYLALTGNNITTNYYYCDLKIVDNSGNTLVPLMLYQNSSSFIQNNHLYETCEHAVYLGWVYIDTEETYYLDIVMYPNTGIEFVTSPKPNDPPLTTVYTQGFGVYFTSGAPYWDDYTIGEFTMGTPTTYNDGYKYLFNWNTGSYWTGSFCVDTDMTVSYDNLKLFIDFGLGHAYYQQVYYAAGDYGF